MTKCLNPNIIDLLERGIDEPIAAELRTRFATFAEDWDAPEMDVYDTEFANNRMESWNKAASTDATRSVYR